MPYTVMLKSPLTANTGYGHDAFGIIKQIVESRQDLRLLPTWVYPPLPMYVAVHLVNGLDVGCDLLLHHDDAPSLGLKPGEAAVAGGGFKVAWTMWEKDTFDSHPDVAKTLADRLSTYDLLVVYDMVSADAFRPYAEQAGVPMRVLQGGYESEQWRKPPLGVERIWPDQNEQVPFRFVMVGDSPRKDPFIAARALEEVRKVYPHTELHIKGTGLTHPAFAQENPGVYVYDQPMSQVELSRLYYSAHAYLAPSHGEGKNLPALEAQTTGIPALYSMVGGHLAWGDASYGYPLKTKRLGDGSSVVVFDDLVSAMMEVVRDVSEARRRGDAASRVIPPMCDWQGVWRQFMSVVRDAEGSRRRY